MEAESEPFEHVYERYAARVYGFCLWQVRNAALAEDIAADTFVAAYKAYTSNPPEPGDLAPWLFRIARNLVIDHRRRERRRDRILQAFGRGRPGPEDVEQIAETNARLARSLSVMSKLKERDRRLISLRVGGELSYREIGNLVGLSEQAATHATYRALERFRRLVEEPK